MRHVYVNYSPKCDINTIIYFDEFDKNELCYVIEPVRREIYDVLKENGLLPAEVHYIDERGEFDKEFIELEKPVYLFDLKQGERFKFHEDCKDDLNSHWTGKEYIMDQKYGSDWYYTREDFRVCSSKVNHRVVRV